MSTIDLEQPPQGEESEAIGRARAFLDGAQTDPPAALTDDAAEALAAALVRRGDAARLAHLAERGDKSLAKRARRGLHLLRARGVSVEVPRHAAPAPPRATTAEEGPPSLASSYVRDGEQMLWLARDDDGKVNIFQAQVREALGLVRFEPMRTTRKQWRTIAHGFQSDERLPVVPVDAAWVRWRFEEAAQKAAAAGRTAPREYAESRQMLGPVTPPAAHPALALVPASAALAAAREPGRFPSILELPEAATWIPDTDDLQRAFLQVQEVATSRLVVDEQQRAQQVDAVIRRAAEAALATPLRARIVLRLYDTAMLIARRAAVGPRGRDYAGDAALCLAAARHMENPDIPADEILLMYRMYARMLEPDPGEARARAQADAAARAAEEARSPGGLILPASEPPPGGSTG